MQQINLIGISGSLRKGSLNTGLLRAAVELLPEGVHLDIYSLRQIPPYNYDMEAAAYPEPVRDFKDRIRAADGLIIASPEYNFSISGVLKNAIDWASRPPKENPFSEKPAAIMGASSGPYGTARAQYELRKVANGLNMLVMNRPELMIANGGQKFDADGNLTDPEARERLRKMVEAFAVWIRRMNGN